MDQLLGQGLQGGSGGMYGYYLKQVGGPAIAALNDGLVYDPASALKILLLTYAYKQVEGGEDSLTRPVTVYQYPNSRNANGDPSSPNLCPDPGDETAQNIVNPAPSLADVLNGMMQISNNRYTRAIELRYGRTNLQAFAASLGMKNTSLDQIFGCGDDGGVQNSWTLDDAGTLYEALATNHILSAQDSSSLFNTMLSWDGSSFSNVVVAEAKEIGIPSDAASFTADVTSFHKGGSYDICSGSCAADDEVFRDEAGLLRVPVQTPNGVVTADYAWGVFIANLRSSCPSFPCAAADNAGNAVESAAIELSQPAIAAALQTWAGLTTLAAAPATYQSGKLDLRAQLGYQGRNTPISGQPIEFAAAGAKLCSAITDVQGVAACQAPLPRVHVSAYTASFAGTNTLRPAAATATIGHPRLRMQLSVRIRGRGVVISTPSGLRCSTSCRHTFTVSAWSHGVVLTARPPAKRRVVWTGLCKPAGNSCVVAPRDSAVVGVRFE